MDKENWKTIEGFEDYMVSDQGRVWTHIRKRFKIPKKDGKGYLFVQLYKNGNSFNKRINRLVAEAFIPNPEGNPEVNHINEIKTDNRVENLEFVTHQYNSQYSLSNYWVLYDPDDKRVEIFNLEKFARERSLNSAHLHQVAQGKQKSYKGYTREPGTKLNRTGTLRLISPQGEVMTFNNGKEAADYIGGHHQSISELVKGKRKSCKGYKLYPLDGIFAFT